MNTTDIKSAVAITTKNGHKAVVINNEYTVSTSSDGRYFVAHNVAKGKPSGTITQPFVDAFIKFFADAEISRLAAIEAEKAKEAARIASLRERILKCETPGELVYEFGFTLIDTARHWSDLYEGRSKCAVRICNREDAEIMEIAVDLLDISGGYGEACRRDGAQHNTFIGGNHSLEDYQDCLKRHFARDEFFYKSKETEKEFYCDEIGEAAKELDMEKVQSLISDYNELIAGYYDCNGNMEMSDEDLNNPDISGYSYDVYSYSFAFQFEFNGKFNDNDEETED